MSKGEQKNIVYILPGLTLGGLERQLVQQLPYLLETKKFRIAIITLSNPTTSITLHSALPAGVEHYQFSFQGAYDIRSYREIIQLLKKLRPQIVVSSAFFANTVSRVCKFFVGYKTVAREHNLYPERTWLQNRINQFLYFFATDVYLAVSEESARSAERAALLPKNSVHVFENGIDFQVWNNRTNKQPMRNVIRNKLGFETSEIVVLVVSRLSHKKRIDLLLKSFDLFYKKNKSAKLAIVGEGKEMSKLKSLAENLECSSRINFFGSQTEVESFYIAADIYALTSSSEGFPNVLLEAQFYGLPIVATRAPGVPRIIVNKKMGRIVDADPVKIAEAFCEVVSETEKSVITSREITDHVKQFSIDKIVKKYIDLFDSL